MIRIIHTITLGLFLLPCFLVGSENAPTEAQKKQWAADAQRYKAMVTALGGKFADSDHTHEQKKTETQAPEAPKKILDQPAKL